MEERIDNELVAGEGVMVGDTKYEYGADLDSDKAPLVDLGIGKAVLVRLFEFKMNPLIKQVEMDKQALFNSHAKQIATLLWADGLVPLDENAPRVIIDNKKEVYQIFVPCQAKAGAVFADAPKNLSEELLKNGKLDTPKA